MWFPSALLLLPLLAQGQSNLVQQTTPLVTLEKVEAAVEALVADDPKFAEEKSALEDARKALVRRAELQEQITGFRNQREQTELRLQALKEASANPTIEWETPPPQGASLEDLEAFSKRATADLEQMRTDKATWRKNQTARADRLAALPNESARTKQEATTARENYQALGAEAKSSATGYAMASQIMRLQARMELQEAEQRAIEAFKPLDPLMADRFQRLERELEERANQIKERVTTLRTREAEAASAAAKRQAQDIKQRFQEEHQELAKLAADNEKLAALLGGIPDAPDSSDPAILGLPARNDLAYNLVEASRKELTEIEARHTSNRERMRRGGLTESTGRFLRRDFESLPTRKVLASRVKQAKLALEQSDLQLFEVESERQADGDPDLAAQQLLPILGATSLEDPLGELAKELLERRRELQDKVIEGLTSLGEKLTEHQEVQLKIQTAANSHRDYIESRILWIKSAKGVFAGGMNDLPQGTLKWMGSWLNPRAWAPLWAAGSSQRLPLTCLVGILFALLIAGRRFVLGKRDEMNQKASSRATDRFVWTARALAQTAFLTLPIPLVIWYAGTLFANYPLPADEETRQVILGQGFGNALREVAGLLWVLLYVRSLMSTKGVGELHFKWSTATTALLRRTLRWFTPLIVFSVLVFKSSQSEEAVFASVSVTLARFAFCLAMFALAFAMYRIGRADSPIWGKVSKDNKAWWSPSGSTWATLAALVPIALIVLALMGYYYTAVELEWSLRRSLALAIGLTIVYAMLLRWLNITRWKLAIAQARERARQRVQAQAKEGNAGESTVMPAFDESEIDLPALDTQTRRLFRSGVLFGGLLSLYFIWASVLPALKGLDNVQLYPSFAIIQENETSLAHNHGPLAMVGTSSEDGSTSTESSSPSLTPTMMPKTADSSGSESGLPSSITLGDLITALILLILTIAATRNLPSLLEIALLQRLPLDGGSRYAVSTLLRYLILIVGISAISSALGLGWDRIQWLVAALTFGLAFGLQEIFANFVSGLIILLERPIRVGDVVTVGVTEGIVTRLRMRATTVQDFDRRELLVPNKEFITSSVINWTLTDPITRIIVKVGVAYGSDVDKVRTTLLKIAKSNSYALNSPNPTVIFRAFGDSTLDFELRVFIANRDNWPLLVDSINTAIDQQFAKLGIEIAFPQRDLHIRSGLEQFGHQVPQEPSPET